MQSRVSDIRTNTRKKLRCKTIQECDITTLFSLYFIRINSYSCVSHKVVNKKFRILKLKNIKM